MDFNITNFNERLKSVKLRELVVAGIAAIILGVILSEIFPPFMILMNYILL